MPKRITPLSDLRIRTAKPGKKDAKLFDGRGLFLLVTTSGGKLWRFKYRFDGKEKLLSLGAYPEISLGNARLMREEARQHITAGIDPASVKKAQNDDQPQDTLEQIAREWHERFSPKWAKNTADRILTRLELNVFPFIGNKPIAEIKAPDLLSMLRRIEARGAAYTAHRVRGICGQIYRFAVATGKAERDPTADLKGALTPVKTTHRPAITDPKELAGLLRMLDSYEGIPIVQAALKLLPMLFVRPGELRNMRWEDVDLEKGEWSYMVNKTKSLHIVPLARQALAILQELQPLTGPEGYVFPSVRTNARPISDMTLNAAMRRMGIDTRTEITGHGFRAVARTILDEVLGFRPELIEHQLAHSVRDPLGRAYNRTAHLPERRKMMQAWADYLEDLKTGNKVIPIRHAG
jgi:integrase